jgi:hypothetical protein
VKPNSNSVEVHPQLSNNKHPMDGAQVGAGSPWPLMLAVLVFWALANLHIFPICTLPCFAPQWGFSGLPRKWRKSG